VQFVDRDVPVQTPLDPRLTAKPATPAIPLFRCKDKNGRATVCNEDMLKYLDAYKQVAGDAFLQLDTILSLQPKKP
jgi:hypothetical protein